MERQQGAQLILDRYRVIKAAGSGGYATVLHAHDTKLGRDVAIKRIQLSESDMARARLIAMEARMGSELGTSVLAPDPEPFEDEDPFDHIPGLQEARMVAKISDDNIVHVYECEFHENTAYIIMEYVEGKTLTQVLSEAGDSLTLDAVAAIFSSVAHALEVAHGSEILHLDIKPDNVMINQKGVVKVTDFGLATLVDATGHGTAGGGTIGYMPLEQMRQQPLDARTDQWSLAAMTYEMLSGSNPFFRDTLVEAEEAIEEAELVLPSLCWDDMDPGVDDVIFRALDLEPSDRYPSVAAFADQLMPFLGSPKHVNKELSNLARGVEPPEPAPEPPKPKQPVVPLMERLVHRSPSVLVPLI